MCFYFFEFLLCEEGLEKLKTDLILKNPIKKTTESWKIKERAEKWERKRNEGKNRKVSGPGISSVRVDSLLCWGAGKGPLICSNWANIKQKKKKKRNRKEKKRKRKRKKKRKEKKRKEKERKQKERN